VLHAVELDRRPVERRVRLLRRALAARSIGKESIVTTKPENPLAFPVDGPTTVPTQTGMTLRDYFAAAVLPVVAADLAQDRNESDPADLPRLTAKGAYLYADAMLAERAKIEGKAS
jgi:hypothetical protein